MSNELSNQYTPADIEQDIYQSWENNGNFAAKPADEAYCIMIPPPNVTGSLHMGHAFQDTIMDVLTRYHRMKGKQTLWQVGTDHAGIATQMVVERRLANEGISRHDLGREKFTDKVWEWKAESGGTQLPNSYAEWVPLLIGLESALRWTKAYLMQSPRYL